MQLLRCGCHLLGECPDFICFSLYRGNSRSDLLEHPLETLLEEAEHIDLGVRGADGAEHDGAESGLDRATQPAEYAEHQPPGGDRPATAVTSLERFEVFEALLECGGFVVPAAHAFSKRRATRRRRHGESPRSVALRNASTW